MIWQQSKSISMHALMELWQLAVTLNLELNVTQGAWRAFLRELGLFWKKLTPVEDISCLDWCKTCWFGELVSSFPKELYWWQRVRTAGDGVCRGVDNWGRACARCVVTETCGQHTIVLTQGW